MKRTTEGNSSLPPQKLQLMDNTIWKCNKCHSLAFSKCPWERGVFHLNDEETTNLSSNESKLLGGLLQYDEDKKQITIDTRGILEDDSTLSYLRRITSLITKSSDEFLTHALCVSHVWEPHPYKSRTCSIGYYVHNHGPAPEKEGDKCTKCSSGIIFLNRRMDCFYCNQCERSSTNKL
jgi:hypothetical protein